MKVGGNVEIFLRILWILLWFLVGVFGSHYLYKYLNYKNDIKDTMLKEREEEISSYKSKFNILCSQVQQIVDFINDNFTSFSDDF